MEEIERVKLIIDDIEEREFEGSTTVREVIAVLLEGDEGHLYNGESEEVIELDITVAEVVRRGHRHVHPSRCKHVGVTVNYGGSALIDRVSPAATVRKVRAWAVEQNWPSGPIDPPERVKLALYVPGSEVPLDEDKRIGTLLTKVCCELTLDLAPRDRPQGYR